MEGIYSKEKTRVMVYTRLPQQGSYPDGLAYSIHFAWSRDGKSYYPMNHNYGILFAKGEIGKDNTIKTKSLKNPFVFPLGGKGFGILAVRTKEHGEPDEESKGRVLYWTTSDFIQFEEKEMLSLYPKEMIESVTCSCREEGGYHLTWKSFRTAAVSICSWVMTRKKDLSRHSGLRSFM